MKRDKILIGHASALITILIWGTSFISTKVLLKEFLPIEILFFRFVLGFAALSLAYPHRLKLTDRKQEWLFVCAGLCGVTLYFLFENIALTYSMASNVGVTVAISPFFTAILAHFFLDGEKLHARFFVGFVAAITGIIIISYNGSANFELNPVGDLLAVLAAAVWAVYSILTRKIGRFGYHPIAYTRRIFAYGLLLMLPALFLFDFKFGFQRFAAPVNLLNILFLGLAASAVCFVTWNFSVKRLGAVQTSVYIYAIPVITVVASVIILKEKVNVLSVLGIVLTLAGLVISESKLSFRKKTAENREQEPGLSAHDVFAQPVAPERLEREVSHDRGDDDFGQHIRAVVGQRPHGGRPAQLVGEERLPDQQAADEVAQEAAHEGNDDSENDRLAAVGEQPV